MRFWYRAALFIAVGLCTGCDADTSNTSSDEMIIRPEGPSTEWRSFGGAPGGGHYSQANEITPQNVHLLERVWVHNSGDFHRSPQELPTVGTQGSGTAFKATPILVNGTLYFSTAYNRVFALDPETGTERWVYDPQVPIDPALYTPPSRGVSSWRSSSRSSACWHRILYGTMDGRLIALDGDSGVPCADFGDNGTVDLTQGLSAHERVRDYAVTSPPAIINDMAVVGAWVIDGNHSDAPSGVVRAYDVRTGAFRWGWNAVRPGEDMYDQDGDFRAGTANVWSVMSVDLERGLVIVPTGNPYPDYYGGDRAGFDHYSSSVVALDAATGAVVWHFQTVHHDIWDYDVPAQPTLVDLTIEGETVPAVVQVTKMGLTFVLHRETGKPLFPVVERPVPQAGAAEGEKLSPTQPFPTKPPALVRLGITPKDAWGLTPWDKNACREEIERHLAGPLYTPPSTRGTIFYPSQIGGHNWGSPAIDPKSGLMVATANHIPVIGKLIPRERCDETQVIYPQKGSPYCFAITPLMSPLGIPCTALPWGTISLVDLNKGEEIWTKPMGALGGSFPMSWLRGGYTMGGPLITSTGLIFIGASMDKKFRALDLKTGQSLWETPLPTAAYSVPMTYRLEDNGPQFVVVAAGGGLMAEPGDHLIAFRLPGQIK